MAQWEDQPAPDVVDNLTTDDATKALSAAQGKALNTKITTQTLSTTIDGYTVRGAKSANVVSIRIYKDGNPNFSSYTMNEICTLPDGWRPAVFTIGTILTAGYNTNLIYAGSVDYKYAPAVIIGTNGKVQIGIRESITNMEKVEIFATFVVP